MSLPPNLRQFIDAFKAAQPQMRQAAGIPITPPQPKPIQMQVIINGQQIQVQFDPIKSTIKVATPVDDSQSLDQTSLETPLQDGSKLES